MICCRAMEGMAWNMACGYQPGRGERSGGVVEGVQVGEEAVAGVF